jgi:hypothetical protein
VLPTCTVSCLEFLTHLSIASIFFLFSVIFVFFFTLGFSDRLIGCVKSNRRGKVEKNIPILKLLYHWDTYRIEIQKDTNTILKILLSRDTKYRFVSLSICIVSNRKICIMNRKILTSMGVRLWLLSTIPTSRSPSPISKHKTQRALENT